jgi:hypothetical protein
MRLAVAIASKCLSFVPMGMFWNRYPTFILTDKIGIGQERLGGSFGLPFFRVGLPGFSG